LKRAIDSSSKYAQETLKKDRRRTMKTAKGLVEIKGTKIPLAEGELYIRDSKKNVWRKKYFMMYRGVLLAYNQKFLLNTPSNVIPLERTFLEKDTSDSKYPFAFSINHPQRKTVILATDTEQECTDWNLFLEAVSSGKIDDKRKSISKVSLTESLGDVQVSTYLAEPSGNGLYLRRWFVLKDNVLFQMESKKDENAIGAAELEDYTLDIINESKFHFELKHPTSASWKLYAKSKDEMDQWVKALSSALSSGNILNMGGDNKKVEEDLENKKMIAKLQEDLKETDKEKSPKEERKETKEETKEEVKKETIEVEVEDIKDRKKKSKKEKKEQKQSPNSRLNLLT